MKIKCPYCETEILLMVKFKTLYWSKKSQCYYLESYCPTCTDYITISLDEFTVIPF